MQHIIIKRSAKSRLLVTLGGAAALVAALTLTGCGKKPGSVDPPPWVEDDTYPASYPDVSTDPKPTWTPDATTQDKTKQ